MNIRIAGNDEIDLLVKMRMEFIKDIHPEYDAMKLLEIQSGTKKYVESHIQQNRYTGFFGEVDDKIVCFTSLLIYDYPPLFSEKSRKIGHVLNFFTFKEYRNRGYGSALMEYIITYAKEQNFHKLDLTATEAGYGLYKKCGFTDSIRVMELEIK